MSRRISRIALFLFALPLLAGCEGGPPWRSGAEEEGTVDRDVFGPTAAYDRRLIFLGPGDALPTGLVLDFAALSDSAALRRGIRARLVDGAEWVPLMDAGWEMEPMREPWRLVPYGTLKIVVGDAGDVDAYLLGGDVELRLEPGATIAEYSPDAGTQLVLRQGRLRLGGEPIPGILLDAQLARAMNPAALPPRPADTLDGENEAPTPDPLPAARAGAEALILDNSGYYAVFAASADGDMAWIHTGGRDDVRRGARLEATEWEAFLEGGLNVPTAWRIIAPTDGLSGELRADAADRAMLDDSADPGAMGYVVVSGYVEDRGVRRNVYGLVRHVR